MTPSAPDAFLRACRLDVAARKPGNVSLASPGHGMQAAQFLDSAAAAAGPLCRHGATVGERIEAAVRATREAAGCNTNLGIVLLCAPLAAANERSATPLRQAVAAVLERLDVADARAAYRAIALAHPGGLGRAEQQDVAGPPTVDLRAAMALAAHRDLVARQYAEGHVDIFELGVPAWVAALRAARAAGLDGEAAAARAMQHVYLEFLAAWPDSHIVRKHGAAVAHCVMAEAEPWLRRSRRGEPLDADRAFAEWDEALKARGLNPGTSADLAVASVFAAELGGEAAPCGRAAAT